MSTENPNHFCSLHSNGSWYWFSFTYFFGCCICERWLRHTQKICEKVRICVRILYIYRLLQFRNDFSLSAPSRKESNILMHKSNNLRVSRMLFGFFSAMLLASPRIVKSLKMTSPLYSPNSLSQLLARILLNFWSLTSAKIDAHKINGRKWNHFFFVISLLRRGFNIPMRFHFRFKIVIFKWNES